MDSVFCGADAGFCRSIQNPAKRVETGCWTARRGCWILPQHPESRKTRGNWMLDGPARILDPAAASRIPQNAWKLYSGRPGADSGFCRKIQLPESNIHAQRMCSSALSFSLMLLVHMHMRACMRTCIPGTVCARSCQSELRILETGSCALQPGAHCSRAAALALLCHRSTLVNHAFVTITAIA